MKKRILALLLAGLMTASLAACTSTGDRPGDHTGGTEPPQHNSQGGETETDPPVTVVWLDTDDTVYVVANNLALTNVNDNTTVTVKQLSKMHRVKISSNGARSIVEYNGAQYYAATASLSTEDLMGEKFTPCTPAVTMYAKDEYVNVRPCASSSVAAAIDTITRNTTVSVLAKGDLWYKVSYTSEGQPVEGFIFAELLSASFVVDPNTVDYSQYFTDCNPHKTMYCTAAQSLRVYINSNFDSTEIAYLANGDAVTVVAKGTVDGTEWCKILIPKEVKPGQSAENIVGYASAKFFSETQGSTSMTLQDMLNEYSNFVEKTPAQTLYVSANTLYVRSTPKIPGAGEESNLVGNGLVKKEAVKVVAIGTEGDITWAMIEMTVNGKTVYNFVSAAYLTVNPDGTPAPLTQEELIAKYSFAPCTEKKVYATGEVICNSQPSNQSDSSKKLAAGEAVTVVATKTINYVEWYLFKTADGSLYFASASLFSETAPAN